MELPALSLATPVPPPPPVPLSPQAVAAVNGAFGAASARLLDWPQDIAGAWIDRPELDLLYERCVADDLPERAGVTVLLGDPGVGKSALLARLGRRLRGEGFALLALKADHLPREIASPGDLDRAIGGAVPVAEALRRLAAERRTVLLIDQLDALADLMALHPGRLNALLDLVRTVRRTPNLHVIVSCRAFEARYDPRLKIADAQEVMLAPPPWEAVAPLLAARGIAVDGLGEEQRTVLRTPQHLALFVAYLADGGTAIFPTYHAMLDAVADSLERRHGRRVVDAAETIAAAMGDEEQIRLSKARFRRDRRDEVEILIREGVLLSEDGLSVAFRHQTLFDFLRARQFVHDGASLAAFVIDNKQESLFVRPILWSALTYLRAAEPGAYKREFGKLWGFAPLRAHLRDLLTGFLGQVTDPDDEEAAWLSPRLDDPAARRRTLNAMAGRAGWFHRLKTRLPRLMSAPPDEAFETVWLLSRAIAFAASEVVTLVDKHWTHNAAYRNHTVRVLEDLPEWDEARIALVIRVVRHAESSAFEAFRFAARIAKSCPERAPAVIAAYLNAALDAALAGRKPLPPRPEEGAGQAELVGWLVHGNGDHYRPIEEILDTHAGADALKKVAEAAPRTLLEALWPWLLRVLAALEDRHDSVYVRYKETHGLSFQDRELNGLVNQPIHAALLTAVKAFARREAEAFVAFVGAKQQSDYVAAHHLLIAGMLEIAHSRPLTVLDYLLGDPRRLAVGDMHDDHSDTKKLIAALAPALAPDGMQRLEAALWAWRRYIPEIPWDEGAKQRFDRRKWAREDRLRLLRVLPLDRMTPQGRRNRVEEERALPNAADGDRGPSRVYSVRTVLSADRLPRLSDDAIFRFIDYLHDGVIEHPKRHWGPTSGGCREAANVFSEFAKSDPERALRLIDRFQPGRHEHAAGEALRALSGSDNVARERIVALIHDLDARGFESEQFRWNAAHTMAGAADRLKGQSDATIAMLKGWMTDWAPRIENADTDDTSLSKDSDDGGSLLWSFGGFGGVLPRGNYPALEAITCGLLCRDPPDFAVWLDLLEQHLTRPENPEVWWAMCRILVNLRCIDTPRAHDFLDRLFAAYPELLATRSGVILIAHLADWLAPEQLGAILDGWVTSGWSRGPQAAAEVAILAAFRDPEDPEKRQRVERYLAAEGYDDITAALLRRGIACGAVEAWREPSLRAMCTGLLTRLFDFADDPKIADALHRLADTSAPIPPDAETGQILAALIRHPRVMVRGGGDFLTERLKELLADGFDAETVYAVTAACIDAVEEDVKQRQGHWRFDPGDVMDIAITLHRRHETRVRGIDLFERLLSLNLGDAGGRLATLDRRPSAG
jgi:hypothetical protein